MLHTWIDPVQRQLLAARPPPGFPPSASEHQMSDIKRKARARSDVSKQTCHRSIDAEGASETTTHHVGLKPHCQFPHVFGQCAKPTFSLSNTNLTQACTSACTKWAGSVASLSPPSKMPVRTRLEIQGLPASLAPRTSPDGLSAPRIVVKDAQDCNSSSWQHLSATIHHKGIRCTRYLSPTKIIGS